MQAVRHDQLRLVKALINELPEKQRTCVQLRDIEGHSYREIAAIMDIPEAQVKVNIFRARQAIKQRFIQDEQYGL
jgi:RNA polymerase sigma-70 factor (ECF subfamily)